MAKRANNEGTICKRTRMVNGKTYTYWEAKVIIGRNTKDGTPLRKSFSGKSQEEVVRKMQEASLAVKNQEYFEPSKATVAEWIELWLNEYCGHIKYQTLKHYRSECQTHIIPAIGGTQLSKLNASQIQSFYNKLAKTGKTSKKKNRKTGKWEYTHSPLSPKTIKNIHTILSKCLNTAIELEYMKSNPAAHARLPKISRKEINPLNDAEIAEFMSRLDKEKYGNIYKLIVFTGLRKAEALGLTWDCIDFENDIISINKQLQKRPVADGGYTFDTLKNEKPRILSVPHFIIETLEQQKAFQDKQKQEAGTLWHSYDRNDPLGKLVFTTELGTPINPRLIWSHYKKIATKMQLPESRVHDLRHTYAVRALRNGDEIKTVQDNLGHATAAFTLDVYGHTTNEMKKASASRMQDFINSLQKDDKNPK